MEDDDCGQLCTVLAAEQHELDAHSVGLVHVRVQVPESTAVEPLALEPEPESNELMDVEMAAPNDDESSSKKPEFITHSA